MLTLTPAAPSLPGGPSAPGLPWAKGDKRPSELPLSVAHGSPALSSEAPGSLLPLDQGFRARAFPPSFLLPSSLCTLLLASAPFSLPSRPSHGTQALRLIKPTTLSSPSLGTGTWPGGPALLSLVRATPRRVPPLTSRPDSPAGPVRPGGPTGPGGPRSPDEPGAPCLPGSPWRDDRDDECALEVAPARALLHLFRKRADQGDSPRGLSGQEPQEGSCFCRGQASTMGALRHLWQEQAGPGP